MMALELGTSEVAQDEAGWAELAAFVDEMLLGMLPDPEGGTRVTGTLGKFCGIGLGRVHDITHGLGKRLVFSHLVLREQRDRDTAKSNGAATGLESEFKKISAMNLFGRFH